MQFRFGSCLLDSDRRELTRDAEVIAIEPQVFDLLVHLIEHRDRVVSRDDLLAAVWGGGLFPSRRWPAASMRLARRSATAAASSG